MVISILMRNLNNFFPTGEYNHISSTCEKNKLNQILLLILDAGFNLWRSASNEMMEFVNFHLEPFLVSWQQLFV
ncbi:uncharacterized protein ASCRUDRAFT_74289 [Ascoidea rubescens DSM 1968]|uniref:Uncharacterized protein n=1 Tax=Ascoidea rubescens DSM 1968 TaxID=1344418 RepID=A0A1D2VMI6_9ASCO|nr:hypothetical protein ASCRUDRAFT_74289 [Ascoidea rubescens DSM 1968]ODV62826.1 hypothetical protein ASCRUDRAFT_74289 [Ascoidea rubescens DSM 1968]